MDAKEDFQPAADHFSLAHENMGEVQKLFGNRDPRFKREIDEKGHLRHVMDRDVYITTDGARATHVPDKWGSNTCTVIRVRLSGLKPGVNQLCDLHLLAGLSDTETRSNPFMNDPHVVLIGDDGCWHAIFLTRSLMDRLARIRILRNQIGWRMNPLFLGDGKVRTASKAILIPTLPPESQDLTNLTIPNVLAMAGLTQNGQIFRA